MRRAFVVAGAPLPPRRVWVALAKRADLVVAADGGADRAHAAGLRVDWLIGDLDGASRAARARIPKSRTRRIGDPNSTDLEKVLRFLARRKVSRVDVVGALGGRLDHTLGSLAALSEWGERMRIELLDERFRVLLVRGRVRFRAKVGTMVSLIAPRGADGVTTRGLRFNLRDARLPFSSLGIHNEVRRNPVEVRHKSGVLFLLRSHEVAPHA